MLDLRVLPEQPLIKFNQQLPISNWRYPFDRDEDFLPDRLAPYRSPKKIAAARTAVYIHIPFCETICNFCPFHRERYKAPELEQYLTALVAELDLKATFIGRPKVDAIFIGGGTPSLLGPRQIEFLGEAICRNFELCRLKEFTFEVEVKSVSRDKLQAARAIGVNRISFGAQTFSETYRPLLGLDASRTQIVDAVELLMGMFPYTNVDLLYGMAGQDVAQLHDDLIAAIRLSTTTIDVYPINNLSASAAMHRQIAKAGFNLLPATTRVQLRLYLDQFFRDHDYARISGYSYAKVDSALHDPAAPIQHTTKFLYHDILYGYQDDEIIGYGSSALSWIPGFNLYNHENRQTYMNDILTNRVLPHRCFGPIEAPERGVVFFPYRGSLEKARIAWENLPEETATSLQSALDAGLVVDRGSKYEVTGSGWLFYVNLMYYFMSNFGKDWISGTINKQERKGRRCGNTELTDLMEFRLGV